MPPKNTIQRLTPEQAFNRQNSVLIDIRSSVEFLFVGHPLKSFNIPWIDETDWEKNPNFSFEIKHFLTQKFGTHDNVDIILICRSGVRSLEAGNALLQLGFSRVFSVDEGFEGDIDDDGHRSTINGWRYRGLPWIQC